MAIRKDLIAAVLVTFCLTVALFAAVPTLSQPSTPEYNPWADLNEDGIVDIFDVVAVTGIYESTGEPVKNVNVTNWPTARQTFPKNLYLRGTALRRTNVVTTVWDRLLVDRDTEYPSRNLPADRCDRLDWDFRNGDVTYPDLRIFYNETFVYNTFSAQSYQIQGYTSASLTFNITTSVSNWARITFNVTLGVYDSSGWRPLVQLVPRSYNFIVMGFLTNVQRGAYLDGTLAPRTINPDEFLGINIVIASEAAFEKTVAVDFYLLHGMNEELLATVPILENP